MNRTRSNRVFLGAIGALLLLAPLPITAQQGDFAALRVRVIDAATKVPIAGARVGFPDLKLFTLTDPTGFAQIIKVPPGDRSLEVTMFGYGTASTTMLFEAHAIATGDIALRTEPIRIDGITITGKSEIARLADFGFYQRRKVGIGKFLGPLEISKIVATQPSELFKGMSTVQLIPAGLGHFEIFSRRSCNFLSSASPGGGKSAKGANTPSDLEGGRLRLFVDGVPNYEGIDALPLEMIQAAEVYVGAETPVQYMLTGNVGGGSATCGVILLWTK